jgi:hypothetical protein
MATEQMDGQCSDVEQKKTQKKRRKERTGWQEEQKG